MNETYATCCPVTLLGIPSAISSEESAAGATPSDSQAGLTPDPSGPAPARANLSAKQAKEQGSLTSGTYGLHSTTLLNSAILQLSLESKLPARLDSRGSTLFKLTWKERVTPQRRVIFALRASGLRISGRGYSGVPTPCGQDGPKGGPGQGVDRLPGAAALAAVPGPCTPNGGRSMSIEKMDATGKTLDGRKHTASLEHVAKFSAVPTPMAGTPAQNGNNEAGNNDYSRTIVALASVPTPTLHDADRGGQAKRAMGEDRHGSNLQDFALLDSTSLAAVATPAARDYKSNSSSEEFQSQQWNHPRGKPLSAQATLADSGEGVTGGTAATKSSGQLNAAYSRWLQGFPVAWDWAAISAWKTMKSQKRRKRG